jgi:hypothetical protein
VSRLAPILQGFFTDRLARQRQASPHTIAAYRDSVRLLVAYAANAVGKQPVDLDVTDRTSADDGHTIMLDLGVEQRKHWVWPVGVVLLRAGTWAGADVGQSLVAVKSW